MLRNWVIDIYVLSEQKEEIRAPFVYRRYTQQTRSNGWEGIIELHESKSRKQHYHHGVLSASVRKFAGTRANLKHTVV